MRNVQNQCIALVGNNENNIEETRENILRDNYVGKRQIVKNCMSEMKEEQHHIDHARIEALEGMIGA